MTTDAITITQVIITAMQRPVVTWTSAGTYTSYTVTAVSQTPAPADTLTATTTTDDNTIRLPQAYRNATYSITVTGTRTGTTAVTSPAVLAPIVVHVGLGNTLRQAVWDIIHDAAIQNESRTLMALHDGTYRPFQWKKADSISNRMPVAEVRAPILSSSVMASSDRYEDVWEVPVVLYDATDREGNLWFLFEQVQAVVDSTTNLNCSAFGVLEHAWAWSARPGSAVKRDRLATLEATLTINVQRAIGGTL